MIKKAICVILKLLEMKKYCTLLTSFFALSFGLVWSQPTVPPNPISCNSGSCTTNSSIDVCPPNSNNVVSNFQNKILHTNNGNSGKSTGSVWWFRNIATFSGQTINCAVTIDAISNAALDNVDDDAATDQNGNSIADFFAPRIGPGQNLNTTSRRGYVQFTAAFYKNPSGINDNTNSDFSMSVPMTNLNYVHYDIDGNTENSGNPSAAWFREIGVAKRVTASNPVVVANIPTELVAYNYSDGGSDWTGFAGSVCERTGVSKCAEIAVSYAYSGAQPSITFRMGYDFKADANGYNVGNPIRQYGSRFGCFNFPQQGALPIKLISFNGIYRNQTTLLNWTVDNEYNFDKFEIQRSANGSDFTSVGMQPGSGSSNKTDYQFNDDLSLVNGNFFYYRLRMVDIDGSAKYSNIIMIRKDQKNVNGISIIPNPVTNNMTAIKINATGNSIVELRIIDLTGKMVLHQQNKVYEGVNSLSLNNLARLQPGVYTLQVTDGENTISSKFSLIR